IVMAILFGLVVSNNPMQFFLKEPDKVFIIVKETKMGPYFKRAFIYNYVFQLYIVLFVTVAIGPLYTHLYPEKGLKSYGILIAIILILKAVQMWIQWFMLRVYDANIRKMDSVLRGLTTICLFYFLLQSSLIAVVFIVYLLIVII